MEYNWFEFVNLILSCSVFSNSRFFTMVHHTFAVNIPESLASGSFLSGSQLPQRFPYFCVPICYSALIIIVERAVEFYYNYRHTWLNTPLGKLPLTEFSAALLLSSSRVIEPLLNPANSDWVIQFLRLKVNVV